MGYVDLMIKIYKKDGDFPGGKFTSQLDKIQVKKQQSFGPFFFHFTFLCFHNEMRVFLIKFKFRLAKNCMFTVHMEDWLMKEMESL